MAFDERAIYADILPLPRSSAIGPETIADVLCRSGREIKLLGDLWDRTSEIFDAQREEFNNGGNAPHSRHMIRRHVTEMAIALHRPFMTRMRAYIAFEHAERRHAFLMRCRTNTMTLLCDEDPIEPPDSPLLN